MSVPDRVIDLHARALCPEVEGRIAGRRHPVTETPRSRLHVPRGPETDAADRATCGPKPNDPAVRLAAMDAVGVDVRSGAAVGAGTRPPTRRPPLRKPRRSMTGFGALAVAARSGGG